MIEKDPVAGTYTADLAQALLWWPRVIKVMLSWVLSFAGKKKKSMSLVSIIFLLELLFHNAKSTLQLFPLSLGCTPRKPFFRPATGQLFSNAQQHHGRVWGQQSGPLRPGKSAAAFPSAQQNCPHCVMASIHGNHVNYHALGYSHGFVYILQKSFKASVFLLLQRTVTTYLTGWACK